MRKKIVNMLKCPNSGKTGLRVYGATVQRGEEIINNLDHDNLLDDDDIKEGVIISGNENAYPITEFIAILLKDADVDFNHHLPLLKKAISFIPENYKSALENTLDRLTKITETEVGKWNREEMRYYDKEVETEDQRRMMFESIRKVPVWRIFQPRRDFITSKLEPSCKTRNILEIGSGNSRTVSWIFNPSKFQYNYIGSDISFKRLLVAKKAVPVGDFIQASAMNLPFINGVFHAVISFGMLHHLPKPEEAINNSYSLIEDKGYFAFHEPVIKPEIHLPGLARFKKMMSTYEHSVHDSKIDLQKTMDQLSGLGFSVVSIKKQMSTFRSFIETILKKMNRKWLTNKKLLKVLTGADEIFLASISKTSKRLGPSSVLVVMEKSKTGK